MPLNVTKIALNIASVTFFYGEDQVTVVYYPGRITERVFAQLRAFSQISESIDQVINGFESLNEMLAGKPAIVSSDALSIAEAKGHDTLEENGTTLIPIGANGKSPVVQKGKLPILKSWDVLEDDGSMFPIDAKRLEELPIAFRFAVLKAIMGDIRPESMAAQTTK